MIAWGKAIVHAMNGFHDTKETGLVRMFRTEYSKDYYWMKKQGVNINDKFVKNFLNVRNNS